MSRDASPARTPPLVDSEMANTLLDPRSRKASPTIGVTTPHSPHPDLSNEVATLSEKLIKAVNHQTILDDTLAATQHELEAARAKAVQLEEIVNGHAASIASGKLVDRQQVDMETIDLMTKLDDEKKQRSAVEKEKKKVDEELENLTAALFEEANKVGQSLTSC
jgi:Rab guanine nucleotide exchange factor SEC2